MNAINNIAARAYSTRTRGKNKAPQPAAIPIEFERADPAALAAFDPSTKRCTMNCGACAGDPRSRKERAFLCEDCEVVPVVQPQQHKRVPVTPNAALTLLLTGYNINDPGLSEWDFAVIAGRAQDIWTQLLAAAMEGGAA